MFIIWVACILIFVFVLVDKINWNKPKGTGSA